MKNQFKFMPMYWEDYALDTDHLKLEEHGAYLLLISYYWRTARPLPDDDEMLSRIVRTDVETWKRIKAAICRFFVFEDGLWVHRRIERELSAARALSEKKRAAINKRWHHDNGVVVQMADKMR